MTKRRPLLGRGRLFYPRNANFFKLHYSGLFASATCGAVVASTSVVKTKKPAATAIAEEQKQNQNPAPVVSTAVATTTTVVREQREKNDQKENVILATHNCRLLK